MTKLTAALLQRAPQIVTPSRERLLSLRGVHLESLDPAGGPGTDEGLAPGALAGNGAGSATGRGLPSLVGRTFDVLDVSDNKLRRIEGFEPLSAGAAAATAAADAATSAITAAADAAAVAVADPFAGAIGALGSPLLDPDAAAAGAATQGDGKKKTKKSRVPPLRLSTIVAHNNSISRIEPRTIEALAPSLHTFAAHNNSFALLEDLDCFASLPNLERLFLRGSPVDALPFYRLAAIARCPKLKLLDGNRVLDVERGAAMDKFPTAHAEAVERTAAGRAGRRRRNGKRGRAGDAAADEDTAVSAAAGGGVRAGPRVELSEADRDARLAELAERMEAAETMEEVEAIEAEMRKLGASV